MKTIKVQWAIRRALCLVCVPLLAGGLMVAQQPAPPEQAPAQLLSPDQLDTLVAPVALYPDALLSQVLVAATYPLEIVEAGQWMQQNRNLQGRQLVDAARQQNWDASVQALVAFPDVVVTMNQDVQWTTALGNTFLAQQSDVMAAVQRMRARAQANGRLSSTAQETVTTETQGGQAAIDIAPANPQMMYVPEYDPAYVWGQPAWGYYPPLYYGGYGFGFYPGINIGLCFGGWGGWGLGGWGWGPNWFGGSVFVNGGFFNRYGYRGGLYGGGFAGRAAWQHDAGHRLGVSYPNGQLAARYGAASLASRSAMTRSGSLNSSRSPGSGNWTRFGSGTASNYGNRSMTGSARSAAPQSAGRATQGQWQHFQGAPRSQAPAQRYSAPAQRYSAPAQRYSASAQRYSAPAQRYSAPAQRYSAPAQRYSAPAQRYSASAQRYSAPSSSAGGHSFSGGGGGAARSSGGGHSSGGGASHGGSRR
jgi:uncharacterized membrane protein YgcG